MRYLHPVAAHEVLIASGTYRYFQGGQPTGLLEHWTIHQLPDNAWFIRVDKDGRDFDGRSEFIEAWRSPVSEGSAIERFDVVASGTLGDSPRRVRATYTIEGSHIHVGRTLDESERLEDTLEIPSGAVLQPGGYIFFGLALPRLVEHAPHPMVMRTSFQPVAENAFMAMVTHPSITFFREEPLTVSGKEYATQRYMAGASGSDSGVNWHYYWIDSHNVFLRHEGNDLLVQLESYTNRFTQTV